jgi:RNA polymerase sigma-70 factor (ECF subfamily)
VSDDEDAQLMLAYARGEMRAFETLYSRHRGPLYRYLVRQARDPEIANDLFQEVWSRVIVNRARYEPRAKFRTFLFTLAHNCFIDHCRRVKSRPAGLVVEDADAADLLPADDASRPDSSMERDETSRRYRAALAAPAPARPAAEGSSRRSGAGSRAPLGRDGAVGRGDGGSSAARARHPGPGSVGDAGPAPEGAGHRYSKGGAGAHRARPVNR